VVKLGIYSAGMRGIGVKQIFIGVMTVNQLRWHVGICLLRGQMT